METDKIKQLQQIHDLKDEIKELQKQLTLINNQVKKMERSLCPPAPRKRKRTLSPEDFLTNVDNLFINI